MSLEDQDWFWGNADKAAVSQRMSSEKDGSFLVRNASEAGQYTLAIRCDGQTRLVRILLVGDKCGFTEQDLRFDSVAHLVDFHRDNSLSVYNKNLETFLKFPISKIVTRPSSSRSSHSSGSSSKKSKPPEDLEWQQRLGLERLRISQTAFDRATRIYENSMLDTQKAEALHHSYTKSIAELERKMAELGEILDTQANVAKNEEVEKATAGAIKSNGTIIKTSLERIANEKINLVERRGKLSDMMMQLREEQNTAKDRYLSDQTDRNRAYQDLLQQKVPRQQLEGTTKHASDQMIHEQLHFSYRLADLPLLWDPAKYLVNDASKETAAVLVNQARKRVLTADTTACTDGIFLIRPSASRDNMLVLTILCGEKISHCLIEHQQQGWGFPNCLLHFLTIGDFVRYYTAESLQEHNSEIRTCLSHPAIP